MGGFGVFVLVIAVLAVVLFLSAVKTVPQGQEWTVERFGKYTETLHPGLHIITPFIDRIGVKMSVQETVIDVQRQDVITRDNVQVSADGIVFFQVVDSAKAAYEVRDLIGSIVNLAQTNLRTVIGSMDLDEVLSQRDHINERLLRVVDQATAPWGVKCTRIEIKDLQPPADITEAMAKQMKAERERRAEILSAEGEKQGKILRAEGEKQSQILRAESDRQAQILRAEGLKEAAFREAEARERSAEAEAKATQMVSDAIAKGDVNAINYFVAQKYVEAFHAMATAPNQKVIMLPMETSGLLASLGGIGELAKDALAGRASKSVG